MDIFYNYTCPSATFDTGSSGSSIGFGCQLAFVTAAFPSFLGSTASACFASNSQLWHSLTRKGIKPRGDHPMAQVNAFSEGLGSCAKNPKKQPGLAQLLELRDVSSFRCKASLLQFFNIFSRFPRCNSGPSFGAILERRAGFGSFLRISLEGANKARAHVCWAPMSQCHHGSRTKWQSLSSWTRSCTKNGCNIWLSTSGPKLVHLEKPCKISRCRQDGTPTNVFLRGVLATWVFLGNSWKHGAPES